MKKYNIIYADPAWQYGSKSAVNNKIGKTPKSLSEHYQTMSLQDLKNLPVKNMTKEDAACFIWVTDSHIDEALELFKSWGFKYKTIAFNWIKKTSKGNYCKNVAPWTMKSSEICLFGTKGAMSKYKKSNNVESLVIAERKGHSKKPVEVSERIEELFGDIPKLEMFARDKKQGWDAWGNEVDDSINIDNYK